MAWVDAYEFGEEFEDLRTDADAGEFWSLELVREVPPQHPLSGRPWSVLAKWSPQDEVVVRCGDDVAVVHLTFARAPELLPHPITSFFSSADDFEAFFEFR